MFGAARLLGGRGYEAAALEVAEAPRDVVLFVPEGVVRLDVRAGASKMAGGWMSWSSDRFLGTTQLQAEAGPPLRMTLKVGPPPDLGM